MIQPRDLGGWFVKFCVSELIVSYLISTIQQPSLKVISYQPPQRLVSKRFVLKFCTKKGKCSRSLIWLPIPPILFTMSDVCAKTRVTLWQRFLMDHRMEERERRTAADAAVDNHQRPKRPSQEQWPKSNEDERATLCPLRIQDDDC